MFKNLIKNISLKEFNKRFFSNKLAKLNIKNFDDLKKKSYGNNFIFELNTNKGIPLENKSIIELEKSSDFGDLFKEIKELIDIKELKAYSLNFVEISSNTQLKNYGNENFYIFGDDEEMFHVKTLKNIKLLQN